MGVDFPETAAFPALAASLFGGVTVVQANSTSRASPRVLDLVPLLACRIKQPQGGVLTGRGGVV